VARKSLVRASGWRRELKHDKMNNGRLVGERPFRAPDDTISPSGLVVGATAYGTGADPDPESSN